MEKAESNKKEEDSVARHCAYCLQLCGLPAKLCGGCKKRAYCSRECQVKDWSNKGNGQRHVNWCRRHECGEEDVDWEVVPIPNKGLGIRAKKLIPVGLKIIVEPVFSSPNDHPGIKDLGPEGAPLMMKFFKNFFMAGATLDKCTVTLRIARVNHACRPNAATIFDETTHVAILFAQQDIQPGEEICICYYSPFFRLDQSVRIPCINPEWSVQQEFQFLKTKTLTSMHGIMCPSDCFCYDPTLPATVHEGRQLLEMVNYLMNESKIEEALAAGDKLLDVHRRLDVSWMHLGYANYNIFRVAIMKSETIPRAMGYIRPAVELFRKICPYSERLTKTFERLMEHPETDPYYMRVDKMVSLAELFSNGVHL